MAAPLNQNEIDALLSVETAEGAAGADLGNTDTDIQTRSRAKAKQIGIPAIAPFRFRYIYKSPVIKKHTCIFDPDPDSEPDPSAVVVRSLSNYAHFRNKKKR